LMRHDAELVVKYLEGPILESDGFQWAGAFKPVRDVDNSFADAEPPAHDDWIPAAISDKVRRRDVNVGLREIKKQVQEFLAPTSAGEAKSTSGRSVAALADDLGGLVTGMKGSAPSVRKSSSGQRGPSKQRLRVEIIEQWHGPVVDGRRRVGLLGEAV